MASNRKNPKGASAARPRSYSELYRNSREGVATPQPTNEKQTTASVSSTPIIRNEAPDLKHEYAYVMDDLRRLGIITGVLIAIMVVASFFI